MIESLGVSAPQLATALGVAKNTVYLWLRGERSIPGPARVLMNLLLSESAPKRAKKLIIEGEYSEFLD